ncbi:hypothetical protein LPJ59_003755 [Coemansia sp. RSA 2399]|nr:hypothetical protein LPJ59_003755 [Coemansia sp. RSA 2399]KAJ1902764.1 hypothetical protein LPJ81_003421 [Coemansia sp. IMI 209127]
MIAFSPKNAGSASHTYGDSSPIPTETDNGTAVATTDGAATSPEALRRQEVASRLVRYRSHYDSDIEVNLERIQDINESIERYQSEADANGSRSRAIQVLTASLADAQKCLEDASLARARIDLELALWMPAKAVVCDEQQI